MQTAHALSPLIAGVLLASVWQGVLLTAGVALALRALRVPPGVRTWIWTAVLLLVVLLPGFLLLVPHGVASAHAEVHVAANWSVGLLEMWAVLALVRAVQLVGNAFRLWRLAGRATRAAVEPGVALLLEGPRRAQLCVSTEVNRPSVAGFFRPRVLLPAGLLETLSAEELEHVVLHEMEHLRRWDDWLNLLQQVSLVLLPLHPALLWLDRRLCRERELACDDGVLAATRARKSYAACLVKLAEDSLVRKGVALALSALGTRAQESELVGRVRRILTGPECVAGGARMRFAVGTLAVAIVAGAGFLVRSPELVSFDGAPAVMAQATEPLLAVGPGTSRGRMVVARAVMGNGLHRAVMANAVFERSGAANARSAKALIVSRNRGRLKSVAVEHVVSRTALPWAGVSVRASVPASRSWAAVPVRAVVDDASRPAAVSAVAQQMTPASSPGSVPASRVIVTEFEVSQPLFAAVPVRGGWLILQL